MSDPRSSDSRRWLALKLRLVERLPQWREHSILLWAAAVGVLGAMATVAFREFIRLMQWLLTSQEGGLVKAALALPMWQRVLVPTVGGLLAGGVLMFAQRRFGKRRAPDYMEAIAIGDGVIDARQTIARSLSSALSVGSGASIGREGPMVQLAALAASWIGRMATFNEPRLRVLVACGAAAGIASAYNAPIAGALFVSEIVLGSIAMPALGPLVVASVTASVTIHQWLGYRPTYHMPAFAPIGGNDVVPYALLGVLVGLCAPLFLGALDTSRRAFQKLTPPPPVLLAAGGLVVGLLSVQVPQVWGNGYSVVDGILNGDWAMQALAMVLVFKVLATMASVGSGAVGGVFTPTLFVGAALGALAAQAINVTATGFASTGAWAAVGMGAMLAATTHAPLVAIIMISEMTASYQLVLPLMLACVTAYSVSLLLRADSVYASSLRREGPDRLRAFSEYRVRDLLKPDRPSISPDMMLDKVAEAFAAQRVQYLYVTDVSGRFLGAVSLHELMRREAQGADRQRLCARDILNAGFARLEPAMDLATALGVFARHHGERLPVVDANSARLLGSVTKTDLLFLMQGSLDRAPT